MVEQFRGNYLKLSAFMHYTTSKFSSHKPTTLVKTSWDSYEN